MKKRDKFTIVHDILKSIQEKNGRIKPTHLLYKSNLSYNALKQYVEELKREGLIEEADDEGKKSYVMTEKGYNFLVQCKKIKEFIDSIGF